MSDPRHNGGVGRSLGGIEEVCVGDLLASNGVGMEILVDRVEYQAGISRGESLDKICDGVTVSSAQDDEVRRTTVHKTFVRIGCIFGVVSINFCSGESIHGEVVDRLVPSVEYSEAR